MGTLDDSSPLSGSCLLFSQVLSLSPSRSSFFPSLSPSVLFLSPSRSSFSLSRSSFSLPLDSLSTSVPLALLLSVLLFFYRSHFFCPSRSSFVHLTCSSFISVTFFHLCTLPSPLPSHSSISLTLQPFLSLFHHLSLLVSLSFHLSLSLSLSRLIPFPSPLESRFCGLLVAPWTTQRNGRPPHPLSPDCHLHLCSLQPLSRFAYIPPFHLSPSSLFVN